MTTARVSDSELRELVESSSSKQVISFLEDTHLLVEETLVGVSPQLSEGRLKLLEKYLAAHLFVLAEEKGGLTRVKKGESEDEYAKFSGAALNSTRFGQMVLAYDTSGKFALLDAGKKRAQFRLV